MLVKTQNNNRRKRRTLRLTDPENTSDGNTRFAACKEFSKKIFCSPLIPRPRRWAKILPIGGIYGLLALATAVRPGTQIPRVLGVHGDPREAIRQVGSMRPRTEPFRSGDATQNLTVSCKYIVRRTPESHPWRSRSLLGNTFPDRLQAALDTAVAGNTEAWPSFVLSRTGLRPTPPAVAELLTPAPAPGNASPRCEVFLAQDL